jgi:hypothetical protein
MIAKEINMTHSLYRFHLHSKIYISKPTHACAAIHTNIPYGVLWLMDGHLTPELKCNAQPLPCSHMVSK